MKPLVVQFSGGRTSAFMARFLQLHYPDREIHYLFENTGKEDEKTLEFVLNCDREWDLKIVWLEAVINPEKGKGTRHKIVDFETASRNGEPYEAMIAKYGLANMVYTHCTRELKIYPKDSYLKSIGFIDGKTYDRLSKSDKPKDKEKLAGSRGTYETAIGIRADEKHRMSDKAGEHSIVYPLIDLMPVNKKFIRNWWANQPFDLELPERLGNCDFCFKKAIPNLVNLAREFPEKLEWWKRVGKQYATTGEGAKINPRQIFRGYLTGDDLGRMAKEPTLLLDPELEVEYDCFCKAN